MCVDRSVCQKRQADALLGTGRSTEHYKSLMVRIPHTMYVPHPFTALCRQIMFHAQRSIPFGSHESLFSSMLSDEPADVALCPLFHC